MTTASQLCLLPDLVCKHREDKVRFLGCVTSYDALTGVLSLEHRVHGTGPVVARVDVDLVLSEMTAEHLAPGTRVNVVGRVAGDPRPSDTDVQIQATMLWLAGPLDLESYEQEVRDLAALEGLQRQTVLPADRNETMGG